MLRKVLKPVIDMEGEMYAKTNQLPPTQTTKRG